MTKKSIIPLLIAAVTLVTGVVIVKSGNLSNLLNSIPFLDELANDSVPTQTNSGAFVFKEPKIKSKGQIAEVYNDTKVIPMYIGSEKYYNVTIPADCEVVTDYATYIYATDMSFKVNIVGGIRTTNIAAGLGMSNTNAYLHNIVVTKDGLKAPQEAGMLLFNDKGIVAICYDSPRTFATILKGFTEETVKDISYTSAILNEDTSTYNSPIEIEMKTPSVEVTPTLLTSDKPVGAYSYSYEDGWLTEINSTREVNEFLREIKCRAIIGSRSRHIDSIMNRRINGINYYYSEVGNVTVLAISDTINHTYACIGVGANAQRNILSYLRSVYAKE